jgi:hypothetical protein
LGDLLSELRIITATILRNLITSHISWRDYHVIPSSEVNALGLVFCSPFVTFGYLHRLQYTDDNCTIFAPSFMDCNTWHEILGAIPRKNFWTDARQ